MERNQLIKRTSAAVFAVTIVLYIVFYIYMGFHENVTVFSPRNSPYYGKIINLTPETVMDDSAPMGKRIVYSWIMDAHCETGDFLCFYISNHHVEVTVDGERIYALNSSEDDPLGKSISSNWCIIPLHPEDAGKAFTIQLTPLIAVVSQIEVEFLVGSDYNIVLGQLRTDAPQLILATLCIALGVIIVLIQCYLQLFSGASQWDLLFIGVFAVILGIWRITDVQSAPLIFSGNPKLLGYISMGMLFLAPPALLQIISVHLKERQMRMIQYLTMAACVIGLFVLALQSFGIADIEERQNLSHLMLGMGMIFSIIASFRGRKNSTAARNQLSWRLLPLLAIGIALDFVAFYIRKSSSDLINTCLFFLIYLSITFIYSFREMSKMVYRDTRTGLFNKARWNELMQMDSNADGFIGILVLDLNGLKRINDTLGHDAGDRIISTFADILRSSLPSSSVICRWGGDEFTVMLPKINRKKMLQYTEAIHRATEEYNMSGPEAEIHFAIGEAMSEDHPGMTRMELFHLADENMYQNKQQWYAQKRQREAAQS